MYEHKKPLTVGVKRLDEKKPKREQKEISESNAGLDDVYRNQAATIGYLAKMDIFQKDITRNQIILMATVLINTLSVLLLAYLEKHP